MSPWLRPRSPTSTTASSLDSLIKTVRVRPFSFLWLAASFLGEAKATAPTKTTPNATTKARRTHTLLLLNANCVPLSKGEGEPHRPRRVLCTTRSKHKRSRDPAPRAYGVNRTARNPQQTSPLNVRRIGGVAKVRVLTLSATLSTRMCRRLFGEV